MELPSSTEGWKTPASNESDLAESSSKQSRSDQVVQVTGKEFPFTGFSLRHSTSFSEEKDAYQQHPLSEHSIAIVTPAVCDSVTAKPSKGQEKEVLAISEKEALQNHQEVIERYKQFALECRKESAQEATSAKKIQELLSDALRADLYRAQKEAVNQATSTQERYYFQSAARCYEKMFNQRIGLSENADTINETPFTMNLQKAAKHYEAAADAFRFIKSEDAEVRGYLEIAREAEEAAASFKKL